MRDPLMLLTIAVSAALLILIVRPAWTHQPIDSTALPVLATIFGTLVTALATRKKDGDKDDDDPPRSPTCCLTSCRPSLWPSWSAASPAPRTVPSPSCTSSFLPSPAGSSAA